MKLIYRIWKTPFGVKHSPEYDTACSFVVIAETCLKARKLAAKDSGDEGAEFWLDTTCSRIRRIGFVCHAKSRVVC